MFIAERLSFSLPMENRMGHSATNQAGHDAAASLNDGPTQHSLGSTEQACDATAKPIRGIEGKTVS